MANKFNISVENFKINSTKEGLKISGLALPFEKISRNNFTYETESIKAKGESLVGRPVLFNHDPEKVIGHVQSIDFDSNGLNYVMDLDSEGPYGWVARKVERGDLTNVSIQASYDPDKSYITDEGVTNAYIHEFYELSVVSIPGFADTTAKVMEKLQEQKKERGNVKMSEEEEKKPAPEQEVESLKKKETLKEEKPEDEEKPKEEDKPEDDKKTEESTSVEDRINKLEQSLASMQKKLEELSPKKDDDKKEKEADDKEDDDKEKSKQENSEEKVEEAMRKDKQTVTVENTKQEEKVITTEDLKQEFIGGV